MNKLFQNGVFTISKCAMYMSVIILLVMVSHIIIEIILRSFFATSTYVLEEMVGYGVAIVTFNSLGYSLENDALIRMNLLTNKLDDHGMPRRCLELFSIFSTLGIIGFVIYRFWLGISRNFERGSVSETVAEVPLWIPEGLMMVGLCLFWLQLFAYMIRVIMGDPLIGSKQLSETTE